MSRVIHIAIATAITAVSAAFLSGCGSTRSALPSYEPPLARTNVQNVRTTAYTHTEADHLEYGNHNALGGTLQAAGPPVVQAPAAVMSVSTPQTDHSADSQDDDPDAAGFHPKTRAQPVAQATSPKGLTWQEALDRAGNSPPRTAAPPPMATAVPKRSWPATVPAPAAVPAIAESAAPTVFGSAAADWSRWPAGTTFRIVSTGQLYRVEDYGWALSGRNTIDLYQPTRAAMNAWGVRREPIQILHWGDRAESLRLLRNHQEYRHIRRMVLELEGHDAAAARLE